MMCSLCQSQRRLSYNSRCRDCYNEYMRQYLAQRYQDRRLWAIRYLGSRCSRCPRDDESTLEFDHVNRSNKQVNISKVLLGTMEALIKELDKCQLLCQDCHDLKTSKEISVPHGGGKKGKRDCLCLLCREARKLYHRNWRARQGSAVAARQE